MPYSATLQNFRWNGCLSHQLKTDIDEEQTVLTQLGIDSSVTNVFPSDADPVLPPYGPVIDNMDQDIGVQQRSGCRIQIDQNFPDGHGTTVGDEVGRAVATTQDEPINNCLLAASRM